MPRHSKPLLTLLLLALIPLLISCNTVKTVYVTKTVVPTYSFPEQPELNEDVIVGAEYFDHVSAAYLRSILAYFTIIDGIEAQYNIDKEYYDELNRNIEKDRQP